MDEIRFDSVARAIGSAASRRGVARALAGGVLALAGAEMLANHAAAAGKGSGAKCDNDDDCGKGLFCKKAAKKGKKKKECRYEDGCGKKDNYCDETDDCCKNLKCNGKKNRCEK